MVNSLDEEVLLKVLFKDVIDKINLELTSPTKLQTFSRMLQRMPRPSKVEMKFELSMQHILDTANIYVEKIIFVKDIPWSIHLELTCTDHMELAMYDMIITCLLPNIIYQENWEIYANIKISGPKPVSMVSKSETFRKSHRKFVVRKWLTYANLKDATKNSRSLFEFKVAINIIKDDRKETMKVCVADEWFGVFEFISHYWQTSELSAVVVRDDIGIAESRRISHIFQQLRLPLMMARLLDADLSQAKYSQNIVEQVTRFTFGNNLLPKMTAHGAGFRLSKQTREELAPRITKSLFSKLNSSRTGPTMTSHIVISCIPRVYLAVRESAATLTYFLQYVSDILDYMTYPTAVQLSTQFKEHKPGDLIFYDQLKGLKYMFLSFFHDIFLDIITQRKLQELPIGTAKLLLRTVAENKVNPYFSTKNQALTFDNITRLLTKYGPQELLKFWIQWLKDNAGVSPLLFDLVPAQVECELPFTNKCSCFDYSPLDIREAMPVYYEIYKKYFVTVLKPLEDVLNNTLSLSGIKLYSMTIEDIEKIKNKGNQHYKERKFTEALDLYDKAIDFLMCKKMTQVGYAPKEFDPECEEDECEEVDPSPFELLLTICRNNRVSCNLELGRNEDAVVDATLVLREIHGIIHGNTMNQDVVYNDNEGYDEEVVEKRCLKVRLQRVKALYNLKMWGQALQNILPVLESGTMRETALPYYYTSLVWYIKDSRNFQYPTICVMCAGSETIDRLKMLTERCSKCRHPYCSTKCRSKDKLHATYCSILTKLGKKNRRKCRDGPAAAATTKHNRDGGKAGTCPHGWPMQNGAAAVSNCNH